MLSVSDWKQLKPETKTLETEKLTTYDEGKKKPNKQKN